jgi:GcrA cell cycle regulator
MSTPWTDDIISMVKDLWKTMSAAEIAAQINAQHGLSLTRNSIVGKLHRLGLTIQHKAECHPSTPGIKRERKKRVHRSILKVIDGGNAGLRLVKRTASTIEPLRCVEVVPLNLSIAELERGQCRYPYGDGPFVFCGHPVHEGSSYCPSHDALCWVPARTNFNGRRAA